MVTGIRGRGVNPMSTTWMSRPSLSQWLWVISVLWKLLCSQDWTPDFFPTRKTYQTPTTRHLGLGSTSCCWGAMQMASWSSDQWLNRIPNEYADVYATLSVNHHFWGQPRQPPYFKNRSVEQCSFRKRNDDPGPWHNKKGTWYQFGTLFQRS